jgi:hypothetical protein
VREELPDGSRMNSVACSPGSPLKRTIGLSSQSIPGAASSFRARFSQSSMVSTTPKCGIGTATPSTAPSRAASGAPGLRCADIWWP